MVMKFSERASSLSSQLLDNNLRNLKKGLNYVDKMRGMGGTMMIEGIKAALNFPSNGNGKRYILFMTDGYIGNENQIFT